MIKEIYSYANSEYLSPHWVQAAALWALRGSRRAEAEAKSLFLGARPCQRTGTLSAVESEVQTAVALAEAR